MFAGGSLQHITGCSGIMQDISGSLAVSDADAGQGISWAAFSSPSHGTLLAACTATTTGGTLTPTGISYTPATGYTGSDTFRVMVTDCGLAADTITVVAIVNGAGSITGSGNTCVAHTISLANAVSGGTWSSGNPAIATVSSAGVVTGISIGSTLISYTISNSCGTDITTHAVAVAQATDCPTGIGSPAQATWGLRVWPNPSGGSSVSVNLFTEGSYPVRFTVTDMYGRKVSEAAGMSNKNSVIQLPAAGCMYIITAQCSSGAWTEKILTGL